MKTRIAAFCLCLASGASLAAPPSGEEVKRVMDFYRTGQGQGVVLSEAKLCTEVVAEGENKNECGTDITAQGATKGSPVYFWMSFMVPEGDEAKIVIKFEEGGKTHFSKSFTVSGSLRYRSWRRIQFPKTGEWTAKIYQEKEGQEPTLVGSKAITVTS